MGPGHFAVLAFAAVGYVLGDAGVFHHGADYGTALGVAVGSALVAFTNAS